MQRQIKITVILVILLAFGVTSLAQATPRATTSLIEISASASDETSPAAAYSTASNTYLVAYEYDDHVRMRMFDSRGTPLAQTILDFGAGTFWPAVAYNDLHDLYGLTYISSFTNYYSVIMCWVSGSTQTVIHCDEIYQGTPGVVLMSPSIAFNNNDSNDDFMIVWQEGNLGDWSIYGHRTTPTSPYSGVGSRIEIALTTLTPIKDEAFSAPDVTYNLNMNEYLVVFDYWTNDSSHTTGSDILGRRIFNNGSGPASLPYIPIDAGECDQTRPAIATYRLTTNRPYIVIYQDDYISSNTCDTETNIGGMYLDNNGNSTLIYFSVSATSQTREAHPDITASEALGAYIITWTKNSGTNLDVFLRHVDPNTGIADTPQLISGAAANARGNEDLPVVAGGWPTTLVAWHEDGWGGGAGDVIGWLEASAFDQLEGRVFEGPVGDISQPIAGVQLSLYCSASSGDPGTQIDTTTTNASGW